jgi:outer membrane lipoprotein SlyB
VRLITAAIGGAIAGGVMACSASSGADVSDVKTDSFELDLREPGIQVADFVNEHGKPCTVVGERAGDGGDGVSLSLSCDWSAR